jgi:hypothetical protein
MRAITRLGVEALCHRPPTSPKSFVLAFAGGILWCGFADVAATSLVVAVTTVDTTVCPTVASTKKAALKALVGIRTLVALAIVALDDRTSAGPGTLVLALASQAFRGKLTDLAATCAVVTVALFRL